MLSAPLHISEETIDDVSLVTVEGELDMTTSGQLATVLRAAMTLGRHGAVVDLSSASFVDLSGLHAIEAAMGPPTMRWPVALVLGDHQPALARTIDLVRLGHLVAETREAAKDRIEHQHRVTVY